VDDLANNVYIAFAEQYQNVDNIENWLRRVLFLTYIRWYKQSKSKISYELNENIRSDESMEMSSDTIDSDAALSVLEKMSEEKQEIIKLRFWGDLKFAEIAEKLNKNEAAVKKMFYRTLIEIKELLE
jgi:RNA polymerase sigma factor (sigma-70 family)